MDTKKIQNFVVPFVLTVSAVFVGLALYKFVERKRAKKVMASTAAPTVAQAATI